MPSDACVLGAFHLDAIKFGDGLERLFHFAWLVPFLVLTCLDECHRTST